MQIELAHSGCQLYAANWALGLAAGVINSSFIRLVVHSRVVLVWTAHIIYDIWDLFDLLHARKNAETRSLQRERERERERVELGSARVA